MKFLTFLLALAISGSVLADLKADVSDLDNRVFDLEERLQGKFPVSPIDARKLRIGGTIYHDQRYAVNEKGYKDSLTSTTRMDMLMAGDLNNDISYIFVPSWFFLSPRNNMDAANRSAEGSRQTMNLIYRLNMTYKLGANNVLTIGRFVAPFSSYVDTYSPNVDNMSYWPQMVVPMGGVTFTPVVDGLMYKGQTYFKSFSWKYKAYVAIHSVDGGAMSQNVFQKYLLNGTPNKHLYGFRSIFGFWQEKIQLGLSGQFGERFYGTDTYRKFAAYGADINVNLGHFKLRAEYMKTNEGSVANGNVATIMGMINATNSSNGDMMGMDRYFRDFMASYLDSNKTSYYVEALYRFNAQWMLSARYDYADFNTLLFHQGKAKKIIGTSLSYFPIDRLMLKLSADKHDYDATAADIAANPFAGLGQYMTGAADAAANPDYMEYSLSATLSF